LIGRESKYINPLVSPTTTPNLMTPVLQVPTSRKKKEVEFSQFADYMILYLEITKSLPEDYDM
jgi:hypothetical protein